jgi:hypothetical protein
VTIDSSKMKEASLPPKTRMRIVTSIGLAVAIFAMVACKQTATGEDQPPPPATAPPTMPSAMPSAGGQIADVEVRVPRETALKLIDFCQSLGSQKPQDAASGEPRGERGIVETEKEAKVLRLFGIRPDSPFAKAGLLNGDRVTDIAGVPPGAPKERWDSLRGSSRLEVHLIRRGASMKLVLIIE